MKTNVKATNIELTEALSQYVDEKLLQVEKFVDAEDESVMCDVEIGVSTKHHQSGDIFRAEMTCHTAGKDFRAESEKEDLYLAINDTKEELIAGIKSYREKQRKLKKKGALALKNIIKGAE
jgi:ribosomal subunit interface protein